MVSSVCHVSVASVELLPTVLQCLPICGCAPDLFLEGVCSLSLP